MRTTKHATPASPSRLLTRAPLVALALFAPTRVASAQDDGWHVELTPYAWATDVGIDARLGEHQVVNETIPVEDLIEDLDLTFQGRFEAQKGEHGVLLDVFYVSLSDSADGFPLPQGAGIGDLDWSMNMTLADVAAIFDPGGDRVGLSFLYGARVIDQRLDADARFTTNMGTSQPHYSSSDTFVDALVGLCYRAPLTDHLTFASQVDVSTGGTDHTWSAFPSLSWSFGGGRYSALLGYRFMSIDFEDAGDLDVDMDLKGPLLGLRVAL